MLSAHAEMKRELKSGVLLEITATDFTMNATEEDRYE